MTDSTTIKVTGRTKHTWTNDEDAKLIDALMELHASGKYGGTDNGFKPGYLNGVQQLLDVSLPNSGLKAKPHIKSRMKTWKTYFSVVYDMVHTIGFGWDEDKSCVVVEDSVWDEYVKSHKGAANFRGKPFPFYEKLCIIFGKNRATGSKTIDLGEEDVPESQSSSPTDIDDFDFVEKVVQDARRSQGPTSSVTSKRKRDKSIDGDEIYRESCKEIKDALVKFGEIVGEFMNVFVKDVMQRDQESMEARELYEKVREEIQALPSIDVIQRFKAIDVIGKDVLHACTFLTLTQDDKIDMIKAFVDG